jgi:hypothetical protein
VHLVAVVERVRQVQIRAGAAGCTEQRQDELAVDQHVLQVVREQVAERDRHERGQQPRQDVGDSAAAAGASDRERERQEQCVERDGEHDECRTAQQFLPVQVVERDVVAFEATPLRRRQDPVEGNRDQQHQHEHGSADTALERCLEPAAEAAGARRAEAEVAEPSPQAEQRREQFAAPAERVSAEYCAHHHAVDGVSDEHPGDEPREGGRLVEHEFGEGSGCDEHDRRPPAEPARP